MFTGIVEELGVVREVSPHRIVIAAETVTTDAEIGGSIAVNGVCLTVVTCEGGELGFDVTEETLARSSLGRLRAGDGVNLERPVTLLTRMGGHLVQGHVDGLGEVVSVEPEEGGATVAIRVPMDLVRYLVEKGSVAVDGVSLTVVRVDPDSGVFTIALIPHTLEVTTFGSLRPGDPVNLEADVIAKYVEGLLVGGRS